ncbi:hypothetical protein C7S18_13575 [Ahniella affigens]|uniref:Uncharacterized protein n=1 Tax=Ahniella affigens TaxID=2021234 RepID=A0A2P1PTK7_9GAMM|nr:hypothetical protein C7S18_13575 [Ahniella affigens]
MISDIRQALPWLAAPAFKRMHFTASKLRAFAPRPGSFVQKISQLGIVRSELRDLGTIAPIDHLLARLIRG